MQADDRPFRFWIGDIAAVTDAFHALLDGSHIGEILRQHRAPPATAPALRPAAFGKVGQSTFQYSGVTNLNFNTIPNKSNRFVFNTVIITMQKNVSRGVVVQIVKESKLLGDLDCVLADRAEGRGEFASTVVIHMGEV
jgi:hypothetical protein